MTHRLHLFKALHRDPVLDIRPGLERVIEARDKQKAKELLKRFVPEPYKWMVDWIAKTEKETT